MYIHDVSLGLTSEPHGSQRVDLGFSQLFEFDFYAANLPYGILGTDFLRRFDLCIDLTARRLFQSPEIEKFSLAIEEGIETDFTVQSSQHLSLILLGFLKGTTLKFLVLLRDR